MINKKVNNVQEALDGSDPINKNMKWSEETFHIWGFNHNKNTPKYDMFLDLIHNDELELFKNSIEEASLMGIPFDIKFRICIYLNYY